MSNIVKLLALFLGSIITLFIYWRALKEDYEKEKIFSSGLIMLIGMFLGLFAIYLPAKSVPVNDVVNPVINPKGFWFWGSFLGFFVALLYSTQKFKIKPYEAVESLVPGMFIVAIFYSLASYVLTGDNNFSLFSAIIISLGILFTFLKSKYKSFSWYKSGKIGMSGIFTLGAFFLIRVILAIKLPQSFLVAGRVDLIPSSIISFLMFFLVYNLSESHG